MKLNILMVQKQNLINLNWETTQMVVVPISYYLFVFCKETTIPTPKAAAIKAKEAHSGK